MSRVNLKEADHDVCLPIAIVNSELGIGEDELGKAAKKKALFHSLLL